MNFEEKLNIVISEIASVYNLSQDQANLIRNNINSRVKMYQNNHPNFTTEETKIVMNSSDIGDFFINRLVNNIRNYDFDQSYDKNNTLKGAYTASDQSLYVGNYKFIEDITRDKLQNRISNLDNDTLRKASINVFNHELGHALQSSFKGKYGNNNTRYMQLISNLNVKYPNFFKLQATSDELTSIQEGMKAVRKDDKSKEAREFYAKNAYSTHLDEIFNEDEALKVTGVNKPQLSYDMGNGFSKKIYNYQSSNYKITSYGKMMKIVMGEDLTFKAMYEDSIVAYEFFDQFKDISDNIYQGKPPMYNILNSLEKIKTQSSLVESQKLDLFLTTCLKKRVLHDLKNPNLTQEDINKINNYVLEFSEQMVKNPNLITKQDQIISNIRNMIIEREKSLGVANTNQNTINNNQTTIGSYSHPKANELNELERKKLIARQNNNILLYNQLQKEIEQIIRTNRAEVNPQQWDTMSLEERISFVKVKMLEAKNLNDRDDFNYWNANLKYLNSQLQEKSQIKENQTVLQNNPFKIESSKVGLPATEPKIEPSKVELPINESKIKSEHNHTSETLSQNKDTKNDKLDKILKATYKRGELQSKYFLEYLKEMIEIAKTYYTDRSLSEEERKQLLGEMFYNEGYLVDALNNKTDMNNVMDYISSELDQNKAASNFIKVLENDFKKKYDELYSKDKQKATPKKEEQQTSNNGNKSLANNIKNIKQELSKFQRLYQSMMSDKTIDDDELFILIQNNQKLLDNCEFFREIAEDKIDKQKLDIIIDNLKENISKMRLVYDGINESKRIMH